MRYEQGEQLFEQEPTSPYREVFEEIEQRAERESLTPQAAYEIYSSYLDKNELDPMIYLSMAITSGGYARDEGLSIGEVIEGNNGFGDIAKKAFLVQHPEFTAEDIILPSELGKVKGWSQSDYLLFWFHVICGPEPKVAKHISVAMKDSLAYPSFTDKSLSQEQRWNDYLQFTKDYHEALLEAMSDGDGKKYCSNIQAMIMILDGEMSLGGRAEEELCRRIGIPPQFGFVDGETILEVSNMSPSLESLQVLGAVAYGSNLNPSDMQFIGVSKKRTDYSNGWKLGMRKTGLMGAILTKEYYEEKGSRPKRYSAHN